MALHALLWTRGQPSTLPVPPARCLHQVHSCGMCMQAAPPELIMLDCYDGEGTIPADLSGVQRDFRETCTVWREWQ